VGSHLTAEHLHAILPTAPAGDVEEELPYVYRVMREYEINTKLRFAAFIANVAKESGQLWYVEELADGWAYEGRTDLGNTFSGDGPRFKGHGYIQITGRHNHGVVGDALGVDAINDPQILTRMPWAWLSAGYYWRYMSSWGNLNDYADNGDFESTVLGVRGGPDSDRRWFYDTAMSVLPDDLDLSEEEELATKYKEVTLRVGDQGWLYRENTDPIEWAKAPDLADKQLVTDSKGWIRVKGV
jgi:putative chitinase